MSANLALGRMTWPGLSAPSHHWTKSDKRDENILNILFPGNILLPGPPGILLSFLKLQNIFIRIILIRHCLQGICSAEIISPRFRFISITVQATNILLCTALYVVSCLVAIKKSLNSIDKVVTATQLQLVQV